MVTRNMRRQMRASRRTLNAMSRRGGRSLVPPVENAEAPKRLTDEQLEDVLEHDVDRLQREKGGDR